MAFTDVSATISSSAVFMAVAKTRFCLFSPLLIVRIATFSSFVQDRMVTGSSFRQRLWGEVSCNRDCSNRSVAQNFSHGSRARECSNSCQFIEFKAATSPAALKVSTHSRERQDDCQSVLCGQANSFSAGKRVSVGPARYRSYYCGKTIIRRFLPRSRTVGTGSPRTRR